MLSNQTSEISREMARKAWRDDETVGAWQRAVLVVAVIMSVVSGVAAFAFLTTPRPMEHRVTWVLLPPKAKTVVAATGTRGFAAANLLAARAVAPQHGT